MFRRTRGSNGPVERAGGQKRYRACQALHDKAPLGRRESARATSNGVNFRDEEDTGRSRQFSRSGQCRIDIVSIGGDPMSRPGVGQLRDGYRNYLGE